MIRSYLAAAAVNALGARANIVAPAATAETNWRRFNMATSTPLLAEMLGASKLPVNTRRLLPVISGVAVRAGPLLR
jgi:hypothetical protein